ncbi:MAG TPA: ABC transporter ATP-binding protein, partial [Acidimicrobiales bacterium]|nr:ABC transporter ATP-binding protein [Acidimicrobiales bacterium]
LFLVGGFRMLAPLNKIIFGNSQCRASLPSLEQVQLDLHRAEHPDTGLAAEAGEVSPSTNGVALAATNGVVRSPPTESAGLASRISADHINFSYVPDRPVLTDVTFEVSPGESVGLVGSSGAGKSTLVDILLGLLEPDSGGVYIDGHPLVSVGRQWRGMIGYVPQSIALFDDTVRANVALRAPGEDDDAEIWRALRMSQLEETIRALPNGIDTVIGEHGTRLSGGQRQRLGVARALFGRPRVMMFDEATSALDNDTESRLTDVLESLRGTITTITIAHRLSTVRRCDRLFYLEGGRLVAQGTFAELNDDIPDFARLVELSVLEV